MALHSKQMLASLVSDIQDMDGKIASLFLQCMKYKKCQYLFELYKVRHLARNISRLQKIWDESSAIKKSLVNVNWHTVPLMIISRSQAVREESPLFDLAHH